MVVSLLLALALACQQQRDGRGRISRSGEAVRQFMAENPCPGGPDRGSTSRCRGWVVDHLVPRCAGGADEPSNMAWQTAADGRRKDRAEVALCRWIYRECGNPWYRRKR